MLILDTNVVSELMRTEPDRRVVIWLDRQPPLEVHITAPTVAEISFGIERLPTGRRQRDLEGLFRQTIERSFSDRIIPFDREAAAAYGSIMARRQAAGRPMSVIDGQIAAIAAILGATLATRNTSDFDDTAVPVLDPFAG